MDGVGVKEMGRTVSTSLPAELECVVGVEDGGEGETRLRCYRLRAAILRSGGVATCICKVRLPS